MNHSKPLLSLQACDLAFVRNRSVVLRDLHLAVAAGEAVAVLGDNGAGKSTLLLCLAGCLRPARGQVRWLGCPAARDVTARRHIGFLGHETGLYSALTSLENLVFACRLWGLDRPHERAVGFLADLGLTRQAHTQVHRLSRGMRQRLAIARAVIHDPPVLLLDEPFTCIDAAGRDWLERFLHGRCAAGRALLFTSHDSQQCTALADRLLLLREGHLLPLDIGIPHYLSTDEPCWREIAPARMSPREVTCG